MEIIEISIFIDIRGEINKLRRKGVEKRTKHNNKKGDGDYERSKYK